MRIFAAKIVDHFDVGAFEIVGLDHSIIMVQSLLKSQQQYSETEIEIEIEAPMMHLPGIKNLLKGFFHHVRHQDKVVDESKDQQSLVVIGERIMQRLDAEHYSFFQVSHYVVTTSYFIHISSETYIVHFYWHCYESLVDDI